MGKIYKLSFSNYYMKKGEEYKGLPSWIYLVYGIIIVLLSVPLVFNIFNDSFGYLIQGIPSVLIGFLYISLGTFLSNKCNYYTDLSIKLGFIPFIISLAELSINDLSPGELLFNGIMTSIYYFLVLLSIFSWLILLIGLFKKK